MSLHFALNNALSIARQTLGGIVGRSIDNKRPAAWDTYGYPENVDFDDLYIAYDRTGAGRGAIERINGKCWESLPRIKLDDGKDDVSGFETEIEQLMNDDTLQAWSRLIEFDKRGMVGYMSALIYRVADNKKLDEPLDSAQALVELIPCWENEIKPLEWGDENTPERNGKPIMWSYSANKVVDSEIEKETYKIHWTRVQEVKRTPTLKAGYNSLIDMAKVSGGSGESFLKNSARTVTIELDKDMDVPTQDEEGNPISMKKIMNEQVRALNNNQDAAMILRGGKVSTLQSQIADPTGPWSVPANEFAASIQVPFTILFGQQTGRLASDQDKQDMAARCTQRRIFEINPMLSEFVRRMQKAAIMPQGVFVIEWDDLGEPSDTEKLDKAQKMVAINKLMFDAGNEAAFSQEEIRLVAGYEPMTIKRPVIEE